MKYINIPIKYLSSKHDLRMSSLDIVQNIS